ncbi:hypothetical protein ACFFRR_000992 [Megaselia abdita]
MSNLRNEALKAFKSLHRAKNFVFQGDEKAINGARVLINENFQKNKNINNEEEIHKLLKLAKDVENELKTNVIQAREKTPGVYEARITEDTPRLENVMFNPDATMPESGTNKKCKKT